MTIHIEKMTRISDPTTKLGWAYYMDWKNLEIPFGIGDPFYFSGEEYHSNIEPREAARIFLEDIRPNMKNPRPMFQRFLFDLGFSAAINDLCLVKIFKMEDREGNEVDPIERQDAVKRGAIFIRILQEEWNRGVTDD
jgi:hypothetical protein